MTKGIPNQVRVVENQPGGRVPISQLSAHTDSNTTAILDDAPSTSTSSLAVTTETIGGSSASGSKDASTIVPVGRTIDVGMDALALEGHGSPHERPTGNGPASHLRVCPPNQQFRVSDETKHLYPSISIGWNHCSWIIVFRGCDIGVFYDFWYVYE